jgi:serine phosphatase RsbU (regulator of sigma subunit)
MVQGVVEAVRRFAGDAAQSDDIAVLAIRYHK